jgi:EpsD family peptidyl-prolyl cis-trans isomerase
LILSSFSGRPVSRFFLIALAFGSVTLAACKDEKKSADPSQVAATVNGDEVSVHQVRLLVSRQPMLAARGQQAGPIALDGLIRQELLAQAARKEGLDKSPDVIQSFELAKREILARAYQERLTARVTRPDTETVNRYYAEHPELFAQRKLYTLAETMVQGKPDQLRALLAKAEQLSTIDAVRAAVESSGLPTDGRIHTMMAEEVPMDIVARLVHLKEGQTVGVIRPQGLGLVTLLQAQARPMTRDEASDRITLALQGTAQRKMLQEAEAVLRKDAKITVHPPFAAASGAAAASAPASAEPASVSASQP